MKHDNRAPRAASRGRNFFRSGELHVVLLTLLDERPQHGYELIADLQERFGDAYRASPGSVYPALSALEAEGLLLAEHDGDRRVYRLSAAGDDALQRRRSIRTSIEARTGARLGGDPADAALNRFVTRVRSVAAAADLESLEDLLREAAARIEQLPTNGRGDHERPL